MGYWYTEPGGASMFAPAGIVNADGSDMRWGDPPADELCAGLAALIDRLRRELGRFPSIAEIEAQKRTAWEMRRALSAARTAFLRDLGRAPSRWEIGAGLLFADTAHALESALTAELSAGDTVILDAPEHPGARAVVQSVDVDDDADGNLEVWVRVRTADGGEHQVEPRHIQAAAVRP